jgi:quinolinate synthase
MEALVAGRVVNQIKVDEQVALQAKVALERMLALP